MPGRVRERGSGVSPQGGVCIRDNGTAVSTLGPTLYSPEYVWTYDVIGEWGQNHNFDSVRVVRKILQSMNGRYPPSGGTSYRLCNNYHPQRMASITPALFTIPGTDSSKVPTVFSRGNPSKPSFDAAVFLGELRDFPSMARQIWGHALPIARRLNRRGAPVIESLDHGVRDAAKHFANNADRNFLLYQFGWKPFKADIEKFLDINQAIEKRLRTFEKLLKYGEKGTMVSLDEDRNISSQSGVPIASLSGTVFSGTETTIKSYRRWGTSRWYLSSVGALYKARQNQDRLRALARQVVAGVNVDLSTSWNLMPWSWLVDWAGSTGDYISSQRNIIGATHGDACIMTHSKSELVCTRRPSDDVYTSISGGNYQIIHERKQRTVHGAATLPELTIPILTGRQASILGALATTRLIR